MKEPPEPLPEGPAPVLVECYSNGLALIGTYSEFEREQFNLRADGITRQEVIQDIRDQRDRNQKGITDWIEFRVRMSRWDIERQKRANPPAKPILSRHARRWSEGKLDPDKEALAGLCHRILLETDRKKFQVLRDQANEFYLVAFSDRPNDVNSGALWIFAGSMPRWRMPKPTSKAEPRRRGRTPGISHAMKSLIQEGLNLIETGNARDASHAAERLVASTQRPASSSVRNKRKRLRDAIVLAMSS